MSRCKACGACCRRGGPALHREDLALLEAGILPPAALVTLRAGELARDDVRGVLAPLSGEAITLAGSGGLWSCLYLDALSNRCAIYAERPAQCRAQCCEDTSALAAMYDRGRLTRAEALPQLHPDWSALAGAHEDECAWARLAPLALRAPYDAEAGRLLLEAVRFDQAFRELAVERAAVPDAALLLIFGRPLRVLLADFGLAFADGGGRLVRSGLLLYPDIL
ncbi:MAG: YkgJ family cysteine cluster protein [Deltaproteobacteria bacterium]|nr:YkgJ family cysteine cluster protein [Deltaproteobacteria bacterium]